MGNGTGVADDEDAARDNTAGRLLRAARYERRISQRELAELAGVARTAVGRIEAGGVTPRVSSLCGLLAAMGYRLGLIDHRGRPLVLDAERSVLLELRDRGERHLPPHLRPVPTLPYDHRVAEGYWWGWHRIAWPYTDDWVPSHTYVRRVRREVVSMSESWFPRVWDDAT